MLASIRMPFARWRLDPVYGLVFREIERLFWGSAWGFALVQEHVASLQDSRTLGPVGCAWVLDSNCVRAISPIDHAKFLHREQRRALVLKPFLVVDFRVEPRRQSVFLGSGSSEDRSSRVARPYRVLGNGRWVRLALTPTPGVTRAIEPTQRLRTDRDNAA